jgi:hypothetical protein
MFFIFNLSPYFCSAIENYMANEIEDNKKKDFTNNWVSSSRFLFYVQVFCILTFLLGGCYRLYTQRFKGAPEVEVQSSSKYKPEYK